MLGMQFMRRSDVDGIDTGRRKQTVEIREGSGSGMPGKAGASIRVDIRTAVETK